MAHADEAFKLWYAEIERQFPLLPDAALVAADTTGWGLAWYLGFRDGLPTFAVNATFTLSFKVAAHEIGHALEDTVWKLLYPTTREDPLAAYWSARGFPGTYTEAIERYLHARDVLKADPLEVWRLIPSESWAECFAAVVTGTPADEWTANYGKPIDVARMRAFFESFRKEGDVDRALFDAWFTENLNRYREGLQAQLDHTVYKPAELLEQRVAELEVKAHDGHTVTTT